ncbi:MAG: MFS transporter [Pseudomonadota bacterium]|nr:MFS transporter [Pseudomonadota bacterium]
MQHNPAGLKFGPFWLTPGISKLNACTSFYLSWIFVTLVTFLNFLQPYLLEEILQVPNNMKGSVTGSLNFLHEGTALIVMGMIGALSDRTGRKSLIIVGFLIFSLGLFLFPMASALPQLFAFRFVCAVGVAVAAVNIIAIMQDYPQNLSRGKWGGTNSFFTSFAILAVTLILARLPEIFSNMGYSPEITGRYTFWVGTGIALFSIGVFSFGLYGGKMANAPPASKSVLESLQSSLQGFIEGFRAAKNNPRLAIAYGTAYAARGDMVVVGAFYSLWFQVSGGEQGISTVEALKLAGISMSALLLASVIWAPIFGILIDRINRIKALCIAMTLATIGYFVIGQVEDPFNRSVMMTATFILGIGEISAVVIGAVLFGQEAPPEQRGAAAGVFSIVGTLGILSATIVGGLVFDRFGPSAPFTMMAFVNLIIVVWSLWLILTGKAKI